MAQNIRKEAVAGQFYPASAEQLRQQVEDCYKEAEKINDDGWRTGAETDSARKDSFRVQAVIVPHAGYVFSGSVAASAFACIPQDARYDRVFLIGPSHHVAFDGASVNRAFDYYRTPLGLVKVDTALCDSLIDGSRCFTYKPSAHDKEHCLEVELPFLQYRLENLPQIVPIIIGTQNLGTLREIAAALKPYFNGSNLFVISSDFSHYPSYADALTVDRNSGEAVATGSLDKFIEALQENDSLRIHNLYTSACGQSAIAVLLLMMNSVDNHSGRAQGPTLQMRHIAYRNSGDSPYGGKDQVVGYHSFVLEERVESKEERVESEEERVESEEERVESEEERDQDNE